MPPAQDQGLDHVTVTLPPATSVQITQGGPDIDTGAIYDAIWPAEDCGGQVDVEGTSIGCGEPLAEGDPVRKLDGLWLHASCFRKQIAESDIEDAWLILAEAVAARPHAFRSRDIRAVLTQVADMATRYKRRAELSRPSGGVA